MGDIIVILHEERESVKVLRECIELQNKKSKDYQNPNSNVKQAMHYRRGVDSIHDIMQGKMYRAQSILESNNYNSENFESLEDTYKDLINYASFAVSYLRKKMDGQNPDYNIYNKPEVVKTIKKSEFTGSTSIMIGGSETLNKK
jgi:hypothetical protein